MDGEGSSALTPDERERLARNFTGYDISPDMVRLSLVNMYLHGFADPRILEYDTLTSEDHWHYHADVVLANPPFMNPKGGIRPHKRFSVQSTRSEVLFVDYMAEHLTPNGRAGIIVPEGVIFQSQRAHTQLRKMLVENYLVAVVSLPAGVFNPYSGVKTSILILDKALARQTKTIAFFKVENDGYDLGAQRRSTEANDLPGVQAEAAEYLRRARAGDGLDYELELGIIIAKSRIAENGDYNLSAERHKEKESRPAKWPSIPLGDLISLEYGKPLKAQNRINGPYPVFGSNGVVGSHTEYLVEGPTIIVGRKGTAGAVVFSEVSCYPIDTTFYVNNKNPDLLDLRFCYYQLCTLGLDKVNVQAGVPGLNRNDAYQKSIPLPPLEIQHEIVAEVEGYQRVIDGARAVLDGYRPQVPVDPSWPLVRLGKVFTRSDETVIPASLNKPVSYVGLENLTQNTGQIVGDLLVENPATIKSLKNVFYTGDVLYGKLRPNLNKVWLADRDGICSTDIFVVRPIANTVLASLYSVIFRTRSFNNQVLQYLTGAQLPRVTWSSFTRLELPFPSLNVQQAIVTELQSEQELVHANRELITRMESRIEAAIGRVWEEG